jgi:hypothetical protein
MEFAAGAETQVSRMNYPENNTPVSLENFSVPTMSVNLSGVERWPNYKVIEMSNLTTYQWTAMRVDAQTCASSNHLTNQPDSDLH